MYNDELHKCDIFMKQIKMKKIAIHFSFNQKIANSKIQNL